MVILLCIFAVISCISVSDQSFDIPKTESKPTLSQSLHHSEDSKDDFELRLAKLEKMNTKMEDNLLEVYKKTLLQERRISQLENENEALRIKMTSYQKQLNDIKEEYSVFPNATTRRLHARTTAHSSGVAFHATLTSKLSLHDNQKIDMTDVLTNIGNGYSHGVFLCPVTGTYVFTATVLAMQNKYTETEIVKDGTSLAKLFSGDREYFSSGSNTVVVNLHRGDRVWLRVVGQYHDSGVVIDSAWTSFSGFLLH